MKTGSLLRTALFAGLTVTAGALGACSRQEPESATQPPAQQISPDNEPIAGNGSMEGMPMSDAVPAEAGAHTTTGKIQSIDHAAGTVKITHDAVPSLKWPAMTMDFKVQNEPALAGLKEGEEVEFSFSEQPAGHYVITKISQRH